MNTLEKTFVYDFEEKKSHFIAHITPISNFKPLLEKLKEEHPKARHFVTASRYLNTQQQIVESSSDDGEPKGTSGKPTLKVLQGNDLINIGVVTVRYFGGIKLGTGGLVRAYSDSLNAVIGKSEIVQYKKLERIKKEILYKDISKFEYVIEKISLSVIEKNFNGDGGVYIVEGEKEKLDELAREI